jgi:hypothetical protein
MHWTDANPWGPELGLGGQNAPFLTAAGRQQSRISAGKGYDPATGTLGVSAPEIILSSTCSVVMTLQ